MEDDCADEGTPTMHLLQPMMQDSGWTHDGKDRLVGFRVQVFVSSVVVVDRPFLRL